MVLLFGSGAIRRTVQHPGRHGRVTAVVHVSALPQHLMLAQVILLGWEVLNRFSWLAIASAVPVGLTWASTAFQAVPIHNAIAGVDASPETLARLVRVSWVRTVGWTVILLLGLWQNGRNP